MEEEERYKFMQQQKINNPHFILFTGFIRRLIYRTRRPPPFPFHRPLGQIVPPTFFLRGRGRYTYGQRRPSLSPFSFRMESTYPGGGGTQKEEERRCITNGQGGRERGETLFMLMLFSPPPPLLRHPTQPVCAFFAYITALVGRSRLTTLLQYMGGGAEENE